jgi:hypothetical protein
MRMGARFIPRPRAKRRTSARIAPDTSKRVGSTRGAPGQPNGAGDGHDRRRRGRGNRRRGDRRSPSASLSSMGLASPPAGHSPAARPATCSGETIALQRALSPALCSAASSSRAAPRGPPLLFILHPRRESSLRPRVRGHARRAKPLREPAGRRPVSALAIAPGPAAQRPPAHVPTAACEF